MLKNKRKTNQRKSFLFSSDFSESNLASSHRGCWLSIEEPANWKMNRGNSKSKHFLVDLLMSSMVVEEKGNNSIRLDETTLRTFDWGNRNNANVENTTIWVKANEIHLDQWRSVLIANKSRKNSFSTNAKIVKASRRSARKTFFINDDDSMKKIGLNMRRIRI